MKRFLFAIFAAGLITCGSTSGETPATGLDELLSMPTTFRVESESLDAAVKRLRKQVLAGLSDDSSIEFDIKLLADDLKTEGLTRNQRLREFDQRDQPLRKVLTVLVQRANVDSTVEDPSAPGQALVWVVAPDPEAGLDSGDPDRQLILITTRNRAKERSYALPREFTAKPSLDSAIEVGHPRKTTCSADHQPF